MRANTARCIKVLREIDAGGNPITSLALAEALDIKDTERSRALDIAAGWISTLRRYGFLKVSKGEKVDGPVRQLQVYLLTDWGRRYKTRARPMAASELKVAANPKKKGGEDGDAE